jgi:hypothetical protein
MRWKLPQQYAHIGRPSLSLRRRTRLSHRGQRKKLQEPPLGKHRCATRTSRSSSIAPKPIQTLVISAVISPSARRRETLGETGRDSSNNLCAVITSRYHRANGQETTSRCRARRVGFELGKRPSDLLENRRARASSSTVIRTVSVRGLPGAAVFRALRREPPGQRAIFHYATLHRASARIVGLYGRADRRRAWNSG